jgi:hypothetical protein
MLKVVLALAVGIVIGGAGMWLWKVRAPAGDEVAAAERGRDAGPTGAKAKPGKGKPGKVKPGARRGGAGSEGGAAEWGEAGEGEPVPELSAEDLRPIDAGDPLKVRDVNMDLGQDGPDFHDLTSAEINDSFAQVSPQVIQCIDEARGGAAVTGTVKIGMVVGPGGEVVRSRVGAPAYLVRNQLYPCVKRALAKARFPAPGRDAVVSVPITLE